MTDNWQSAILSAVAISPEEVQPNKTKQPNHALQQQLREIWAALGMTVLFVTHSISEAVFLADRVIVLSPRPARILLDSAINLPPARAAPLRTSLNYIQEMSHISAAVPNPEANA